MKAINLLCVGTMALGLAACNIDSTSPTTAPPAATMAFKTGAKYEYSSYHTDPQTSQKQDTSSRRRVWTLVSPSATVQGRSGVAIYVDSVFQVGGLFAITDSVYLQQQSGGNDIYRYASLIPELDVSGVPLFDLGKQWMHEAKLNATVASWAVGNVSDTLPIQLNIPGLQTATLGVEDNVDSSRVENLTINGTSYATTRTVHRLALTVNLYIGTGAFTVPIKLPLESIYRRTWISADLGAIVKEEREAKVLNTSYSGSNINI
ncbi:MAG: hypothetical protein ABIR47_03775, partial [Candidatus Kapaibacterium sp.]